MFWQALIISWEQNQVTYLFTTTIQNSQMAKTSYWPDTRSENRDLQTTYNSSFCVTEDWVLGINVPKLITHGKRPQKMVCGDLWRNFLDIFKTTVLNLLI